MFRTSLVLTAALAFVTLGTQSVRAGGFVNYAPFSGKVVFVHNNDHLEVQPKVRIPGVDPAPPGGKTKPSAPSTYTMNLASPLDDAWQVARRGIDSELPKFLAKEYIKGVSAYDVKTNLRQKGTLECWVVNDQLSLRYTLTGNSVTASLTTPDVQVGPLKLGVGKYADPRVELTFDVQITINLKFQLHGAPVINQASGVILNAKLKPQNLSGDILNGANEVVKFFGGPDFKAKAEGWLSGKGGDKAPALAKLLKAADPIVAAISHDAKSMTTKFDGKEVVVTYSALPQKKSVIK